MLADDREDVLNEIRQLLAPDFDILRAVNHGAALVEAVAELRPDVVVSDVRMPVLGGIEAGSQILRDGLCGAVMNATV